MGAVPQAEQDAGVIDPVAIEDAEAPGRFVVLCDHASNHIPPAFGSLGLKPAAREAHIAWDPGALGVSRGLARRLRAPLVHATISRLVIDCNRGLDAPDLIAAASEGTAVPGNADLSEAERARRIAAIYQPYHRAIGALIDTRLAAGLETALLAIHSFTPVYRGVSRPWPIGIVFDRDRRLADRLIAGLKADGLNVGINEPYSPADRVYSTLTRHADGRGLAAAMIEIRNDLVSRPPDQDSWAERIAALLQSEPARAGLAVPGEAANAGADP